MPWHRMSRIRQPRLAREGSDSKTSEPCLFLAHSGGQRGFVSSLPHNRLMVSFWEPFCSSPSLDETKIGNPTSVILKVVLRSLSTNVCCVHGIPHQCLWGVCTAVPSPTADRSLGPSYTAEGHCCVVYDNSMVLV